MNPTVRREGEARNDSQVPRGRGRPGAAAPRREPRAGPAPKPLKLRRRLPGATEEFLRLWIGDGGGSVSLSGPDAAEAAKRVVLFQAAVSPFAVRTSPNRSPLGSPGCAEPIRRRRPAAVAFSEAAAAQTPESSHSPGVLSAPPHPRDFFQRVLQFFRLSSVGANAMGPYSCSLCAAGRGKRSEGLLKQKGCCLTASVFGIGTAPPLGSRVAFLVGPARGLRPRPSTIPGWPRPLRSVLRVLSPIPFPAVGASRLGPWFYFFSPPLPSRVTAGARFRFPPWRPGRADWSAVVDGSISFRKDTPARRWSLSSRERTGTYRAPPRDE
ncbi:uncharacterized protein LOC121111202 [Gallus gallus]|uniref:uncharacterized protein LOC121111202 n=1 Tax=Gallus gallus TaxID=9031 RepID=UPI001AE1AF41|nr:uncharacterized protein LOC121111202 [Gallus gallus]